MFGIGDGLPLRNLTDKTLYTGFGTVVETMDSGGYTYMKIKTQAGEMWTAVNQAKVKKGQTVTIATPMLMENFESKTLKRKFDKIVFGTLDDQLMVAYRRTARQHAAHRRLR